MIFWFVLVDHTSAYYKLAFIDRVHGHSIKDRFNRSDMVTRGTCSRFSGLLTHGHSPGSYLVNT